MFTSLITILVSVVMGVNKNKMTDDIRADQKDFEENLPVEEPKEAEDELPEQELD